jgi:hydrogenase expression/formation protein HypD
MSVPAAITGFEPLDILAGIHAVLALRAAGKSDIVNEYRRAVKPEGNPMARELIAQVFEPCDAVWRGIGEIPQSGCMLRDEYAKLDIRNDYELPEADGSMPDGCSCGQVLRGILRPDQCPLFGVKCTPATPVGPCMVSSEGSCAAYYRYERTAK